MNTGFVKNRSINEFQRFLMVFAVLLGFAKTANADPVNDALTWFGAYASQEYRTEAGTTHTNPVPTNYLEQNIANGKHDANFYALATVNARGYKITVARDACIKRTNAQGQIINGPNGQPLCKTGLNFALLNTASNATSLIFNDDDPIQTQRSLILPNSPMRLVCRSGGQNYSYDTFPYGYQMIFLAKLNSPAYNVNGTKAFEVYCEDSVPNLQLYPNTNPYGYPAGQEDLDWRSALYKVTFTKTKCNNGIDDDGDGLIDAADPGCRTNPTDPNTYDPGIDDESIDQQNIPGGTTFSASDGTSNNFVQLNWTTAPRATSYEIYRSQFSNSLGALLTTQTGLSYQDTSAVPGVTYYYTIIPTNIWGHGPSSTDSGFRATPTGDGDCDGDGATDAEETADGTAVCDPGSFQLHLRSPAFTKYNSYLTQNNILELVANGVNTVIGTVTAYKIDGSVAGSTQFSIAHGQEYDVDIIALIGGRRDTYGIVKIDFNYGPGTTLLGRMTHYRLNPDGVTYSFAFARELRNPTMGDTFATGNSFDAQGQGNLVPNWGEVVNLDSVARVFTANLYDQPGHLLYTREISVPRFGESDIQAGHEYGENVYLFEVKPRDGATKYFMSVSRYNSNHRGGDEALTYNYAFSLEGRAGNGTAQYAPIENRTGGCYSQSNWHEIVNVRGDRQVTAHVTFRKTNGTIISTTDLALAPRSQYHLNAGALLEKGTDGSVKVESSDPGSLLTESLVYFHDCAANSLETAFAAQGRIAGQDVMSGSMNSFIGMKNELFVPSATTSTVSATLNISPAGSPALPPQTLNIGANAQGLNVLNAEGAGFPVNAYGTVRLDTNRRPMTIAPFILRYRENADGRMDFIFPTLIQ